MTLNYEQAKFKAALKAVRASDDQSLTLDRLEETARLLNNMRLKPLTSEELREVIGDLTKELEVTLTPGGSVVDSRTFVKWIDDREIATPRWDAYKQLLLSRDWEEPVVDYLHHQSRDVVELLGDPTQEGQWLRRGLLMGEVQSGKTANYIGILNLALDHGYKVVIVIGGHTNPLRQQTQARIDSDLLGIDSEYVEDHLSVQLKHIGIGEFDHKLRAHLMTTVNRDFDEESRTAGVHWIDSEIPTVFVIKKNAKLIENVVNYIKQQSRSRKLDAPLVVIDDESDWGTPNTGSENDPTRVNKAIRMLLETSTKSSYLGITATPFANIFIDEEVQDPEHGVDLFPSDYIRVLSAPSTYFGISQYFLPHHGGIRIDVDDCIDQLPITHKRNHKINVLPKTLKTAVASFLIGTAIRRKRNPIKKPASMLVNISRFNDVQTQVRNLLQDYLDLISSIVASEALRKTADTSAHFKFIEEVWANEFEGAVDHTWAEICEILPDVAGDISLQLVNSQTAKARKKARSLMTEEQRNSLDLQPTVFVGGDVLSRGLTLEGLQVSYFVREPRTMDTLMQMGRWFGYRPGYADLVRVWLPESTAEDFAWSASVTDELRELLLRMKALGMTPRDFGLRVRTHPEGFLIVASNKSKATKQIYEGPIVWQSCVRESSVLDGSRGVNERNRIALSQTIATLKELERESKVQKYLSSSEYHTWSHVPLSVVREFFTKIRFPVQAPNFGPGDGGTASLIQQALSDVKNPDEWEISLIDGQEGEYCVLEDLKIQVSLRDRMKLDEAEDVWRLANRRVSSGANLSGSLTNQQLEGIESSKFDAGKLSQQAALGALACPKLLIYLVAKAESKEDPGSSYVPSVLEPALAVLVAFPPMSQAEISEKLRDAQKYTGNSVYLRNLYGLDSQSDDYLNEDDDD